MSSAVLSLIKHPCSARKWNPTRHYATRLTWLESIEPVNISSTVISRSRTLMLNRDCLTRLAYQIAPPDTAHQQRPKYQATAPGGTRESRTPLRTVSSLHKYKSSSLSSLKSIRSSYLHQLLRCTDRPFVMQSLALFLYVCCFLTGVSCSREAGPYQASPPLRYLHSSRIERPGAQMTLQDHRTLVAVTSD
jgi:hypothetical protein